MAKILIATPTMGTVRSEYLDSLLRLDKRGHECRFSSIANSLVYEARNFLMLDAIEKGMDYIFFIDSDTTFPADALTRLVADAEETGAALVSGITFTRAFPIRPTFVASLSWESPTEHSAEFYYDYPKDTLFPIDAAGMGVCLIRVSDIVKAGEHFNCSPFTPLPGLSEDYSFCWRMQQLYKKMYADSRVKTGHVGTIVFTESMYLNSKHDADAR